MEQIREWSRAEVVFQQGNSIMAKTKLKIGGMSCQHCVKTVTDALTELPGVQRAKVNLRKGEAVVHFDESRVSTTNLTEAITAAGFETL
jgi:copper ion binding protein